MKQEWIEESSVSVDMVCDTFASIRHCIVFSRWSWFFLLETSATGGLLSWCLSSMNNNWFQIAKKRLAILYFRKVTAAGTLSLLLLRRLREFFDDGGRAARKLVTCPWPACRKHRERTKNKRRWRWSQRLTADGDRESHGNNIMYVCRSM